MGVRRSSAPWSPSLQATRSELTSPVSSSSPRISYFKNVSTRDFFIFDDPHSRGLSPLEANMARNAMHPRRTYETTFDLEPIWQRVDVCDGRGMDRAGADPGIHDHRLPRLDIDECLGHQQPGRCCRCVF